MKNKKYPYYETPDVNNLRDVTAYCADAFGEKIAFSYFEEKKEVSRNRTDGGKKQCISSIFNIF